jgi:hypothetical protein
MKQIRQASAANLARHLNDQYADTVLFLARTLAARPAAESARITGLDDDGIEITVRTSDVEAVRVPFPTTADEDVPLRERISDLVAQARAIDPEGPLTTLEQQLSTKPTRLHDRLAARHRRQP